MSELEENQKPGGTHNGSWIIRNKTTKDVVMETQNREYIEKLNTAKYEAVPIRDYLAEQNKKARKLI